MVELPLVIRHSAKGFAASAEIYPRYRRLLTLTLSHQTGVCPWLVCGKLAHSPQASMRG
jgi:hypothetical protein